jgi:glycosyltransferase involved in cell wall biosynthesis
VLRRALASALHQVAAGDEIIVVDDGSTDDTEAIARSFGASVIYLRTDHGGAGRARNAGIAAASGDLLAFLDSDDEWIPGKLAAQRRVMEALPDVLFLFSDFGGVSSAGERSCSGARAWHGAGAFWDELLAPGVQSAELSGLDRAAAPFVLYQGRIFEALVRHWSVFTSTVVVRRREAGDALAFPEDVGLYEDLECFARLARRGLACYMDVETALQYGHEGPRLTDADLVTQGRTAMRIAARVWGADAEYLRDHQDAYCLVMDLHRRKVARGLIAEGRSAEARRELSLLARPAPLLAAQSVLPRRFVRLGSTARREFVDHLARSCGLVAGSEAEVDVTAFWGSHGLDRLEADWRELEAETRGTDGISGFDEQRGYLEHLAPAPERVAYLRIAVDGRVEAICPVEALRGGALGFPPRMWAVVWPPTRLLPEFVMASEARADLVLPLVLDHLGAVAGGPRVLLAGPLPASSPSWARLTVLNHSDYRVNEAGLIIDLECTADAEDLPDQTRGGLGRAAGDPEELAGARYVHAAAAGELETELGVFVRLERALRLAVHGDVSLRFEPEALRTFFAAVTGRSPEGSLEVHSLYLERRCVAAQLCRHRGDAVEMLGSASDPAYTALRGEAWLLGHVYSVYREDPAVGRLRLVSSSPLREASCARVEPMVRAEIACKGRSARPAIFALRAQSRLARRRGDVPAAPRR